MLTQRRFRQLITLVLISIALYVLLIASGIFDPKPIGRLQQQTVSQAVDAGAQGETIEWLHDVPASFSVRGRFHVPLQTPNATDAAAAYGVVVGDARQSLTIAIDAHSGFLSIWETIDGEVYVIESWHTWAHVGRDPTHALWVDVQGGQLSLRINREQYTRTFSVGCAACRVGVWTNSFVSIEQWELYHE